MTNLIREAEAIASTCYRAWKLPKPDPVSVEEAQKAFIAKAAARLQKRPDASWGRG